MIPSVEAGSCTLTAVTVGHAPATTVVDIKPGQVSEVVVEQIRSPRRETDGEFIITGIVVDAYTKRPIAGAEVMAETIRFSNSSMKTIPVPRQVEKTFTDTDGSYIFEGLLNPTLAFSAPGYDTTRAFLGELLIPATDRHDQIGRLKKVALAPSTHDKRNSR